MHTYILSQNPPNPPRLKQEDYEPDPDAEQLEPERLQQVQEKEKEPTRWNEHEDKVLRENWRKLKGRDDVYGRLVHPEKSNTRNRIPGTNCAENAVSCLWFRVHARVCGCRTWALM
eukprot:1610581-Rhodomonas_salina.1